MEFQTEQTAYYVSRKNNTIIRIDRNQNIFGRRRIERNSTSTPLSETLKAPIAAISGFHLMVYYFIRHLCAFSIKYDNALCIFLRNRSSENLILIILESF